MRRFPAPWTVAPIEGVGFKILDASGVSLAYVYGHADERDADTARGLSLDEAKRIAVNVARLAPQEPTPKTDQEKAKYLDHLYYELGMLGEAYLEIGKREAGMERNAFIECFALHGRALHEFLTNKRHSKRNAVAQDFVTGFEPTENGDIGIIIQKFHDQILHTGWARIDDRNIKFDAATEGKTVLEWIVGWWGMFAAQLPPELDALVFASQPKEH